MSWSADFVACALALALPRSHAEDSSSLQSHAVPMRSPELPMLEALLLGALALCSTEVSIVAWWQLGLTCEAEEAGPRD